MLRRTGFAKRVYEPAPPAPLRPVERRGTYDAAPKVVTKPKRVYIRSPELLAAVRKLPCMVTGVVGRTEASHSNWSRDGKGGRIKADDNKVAAISRDIHHELDQGRRWTREERQEIWWKAHCKTVRVLLARGLWPANVPIPDLRSFDA